MQRGRLIEFLWTIYILKLSYYYYYNMIRNYKIEQGLLSAAYLLKVNIHYKVH